MNHFKNTFLLLWNLRLLAYDYKRKCGFVFCSCIESELKYTDACVNQKYGSIAFNESELYNDDIPIIKTIKTITIFQLAL